MIEDCAFDGNGTQAVISFVFERRGGGAVQSIGPRNLLIEDNMIIDCPSPAMEFVATSNVVMRNNMKPTSEGEIEDVEYKSVRSEGVIQR